MRKTECRSFILFLPDKSRCKLLIDYQMGIYEMTLSLMNGKVGRFDLARFQKYQEIVLEND